MNDQYIYFGEIDIASLQRWMLHEIELPLVSRDPLVYNAQACQSPKHNDSSN